MRIARAGIERLDTIEPLWRSLYAYHATLVPEIAPMRNVDETWRRRRNEYESWLRDADSTFFIAELDEAVGYLMLRYVTAPTSWDLGDRLAEVETLSVDSSARGRGVGSALMSSARSDALSRGVTVLSVALTTSNRSARRFYEGEGFSPFYLQMIAPLGSFPPVIG